MIIVVHCLVEMILFSLEKTSEMSEVSSLTPPNEDGRTNDVETVVNSKNENNKINVNAVKAEPKTVATTPRVIQKSANKISKRKHKSSEKNQKKKQKYVSQTKQQKLDSLNDDEKKFPKKRGKNKATNKHNDGGDVWKWWEEKDKNEDGIKWNTLIHRGPLFAPPYQPLPKNVTLKYSGEPIELNPEAEEVATFYARLLKHDYTKKEIFNKNFFKDWRQMMTSEEREKIKDLNKCDFSQIHDYLNSEEEIRKSMTKEKKAKQKEEREKEQNEYGIAIIDGHQQKIANFRIEPPGLFRGRGEHPKMGCLKRRIVPEDVIINCSKGDNIPQPPLGHLWKEIRHDNTVAWLCSWTENVLGQRKYVMLNPSSKLKCEKDFEKFEKARALGKGIDKIRRQYMEDMGSKEMKIRQKAVALYFIDILALRAGNEKDTDETADTVGCCSLRCEHIRLYKEFEDKKNVVEFDFFVFKNLGKFMEGKNGSDELFDRLDTTSLNAHLKKIMPGLTAKCFRTYNASFTLQQQLDKFTNANNSIHEKLLSYNRANRQVAILCNHQRAMPKTHEKSMDNLNNKITEKKAELKDLKAKLKKSKASKDRNQLIKKIRRCKEALKKFKTVKTDKNENKEIALSTSKLNYLDPRISVAWCRKFNVPIEKIFNKTQREKFQWAIEMTAKNDDT